MEGEQDDYLAARQADFEQQFQALPAAGTAAYWQRIETSGAGALPLEVLSCCLRERLRAGARPDAERIFDVIIPHVRKTIQYWITVFDSLTPGGINQEVAKDLVSECYLALWRDTVGKVRLPRGRRNGHVASGQSAVLAPRHPSVRD